MSKPSRADAVVARRSSLAVAFFTWVMRRQIGRHFHALRIARPASTAWQDDIASDRPLIVYSNHPAWWDPALFIVLGEALFPARHGYGPMDAEALARYRILRRVGIFGIAPNSARGARDFLQIATGLLAHRSNMLWLTAQGEFVDVRQRPIALRPGLAHLLQRVPDAIALPLAIEYPFWSEKQPEALCRFGEPVSPDADEPRDALQARLTDTLTATMDALAADAAARDGHGLDTLIAGRAGVGGVYDLARRLSATARGQRFDAHHARNETARRRRRRRRRRDDHHS